MSPSKKPVGIYIRKAIAVGLAAGLGACATTSTKMTGASTGALYPPGVYQHDVSIDFANGAMDGKTNSKTISMKGIVTLTNEGAVNVTGLSSFNTTVFRLHDDGAGDPKLDLYEERLKPLAPTLVKRYALIKKVLLQKREGLQSAMTDDDGGTVHVEITGYDKRGIPRRVTLAADKYKIRIEVTDYEI